MNQPKLTTLAYAAPKSWINQVCKDLKHAGYDIRKDAGAGTITATTEGLVIFRALQAPGGRWLARGASQVFTATD